jgi:YVTN family beta-propeller protein
VNAVTNKIYIASDGQSKKITAVDGVTNQTTTIPTAGYVFDVALNPVTNKVYVANGYIGKVTVIDGSTYSVRTISVGRFPTSIAVNPITNKIYVADGNLCGGVAVIDGSTEEVTIVKAGTVVAAIALNAATNEIYVYDPENVTVIDGATNKLTNILLPIPSKMPRYSNRCGSTLLPKSSHSRTFEGFWQGPN